jgi:FtsP/CotA-like multicopper oxidase with cupredoxin domain
MPFHLRGHSFWIMAAGVANLKCDIPSYFFNDNPLRRDVVIVPSCPNDEDGCLPATDGNGPTGSTQFGYAVIRFVANHPGAWLFHVG